MNEVEGGGVGVGREKKRKAFNSFFAFLNERSLNRHRKNLFFFSWEVNQLFARKKKKSRPFFVYPISMCVSVCSIYGKQSKRFDVKYSGDQEGSLKKKMK